MNRNLDIDEQIVTLREYAEAEVAEKAEALETLCCVYESYSPYFSESLVAAIEKEIIDECMWYTKHMIIRTKTTTRSQEYTETYLEPRNEE